MILTTRQIVYSHDVVFNENSFPLQDAHPTFSDADEVEFDDHSPFDPVTPTPLNVTSPALDATSEDTSSTYMPYEGDHNLLEMPVALPPTLKPKVIARAPQDISSSINGENIVPSRTRGSARVSEKIVRSMNVTSPAPTTYLQATRRPDSEEWITAMDRELSALERMNVWEEVWEHALGTTWVYKRKTNAKNKLIKYKARLCAQGFSQIKGVDYSKTYALTGRLSALRTAFSIGASEELEIIQMDAVGAFLNGIPDKTLYISPLKG